MENKSGSYGDLAETTGVDVGEDQTFSESPTKELGRRKPFFSDLRVSSSTPPAAIDDCLQSALNDNQDSSYRNVSFQLNVDGSALSNSSQKKSADQTREDEDEPIPYEKPKVELKKKGISSRFKAKLFPAKQLPKKRVNSLKKVEKYVNSLNIHADHIENRSVTPVFEQEETLNTDDFIRKRNEFLRKSCHDSMHGVDEIVVLDIPEYQDDHLEAAMERRQALLRYREEKKNSLKLEGIQEESPQSSPQHGVTLPTPEDYEDYLDAEVVQDYPELASTPSLSPGETMRQSEESPMDDLQERAHQLDEAKRSDDNFSQGMAAIKFCSKNLEYSSLCSGFSNPSLSTSSNCRTRSLSDSHESTNSSYPSKTNALKSMRSVHSCEGHNDAQCSSSSSSARESITMSIMSSTSGYSTVSFDSSNGHITNKRATLFLPSATTSLPEISLQPPTPQAPKPKAGSDKGRNTKVWKIPGCRSKFLTVPGSGEEGTRQLPGNPYEQDDDRSDTASTSSESSNSSTDDSTGNSDSLQEGETIPGRGLKSGVLRRFGSSCNLSSIGFTSTSTGNMAAIDCKNNWIRFDSETNEETKISKNSIHRTGTEFNFSNNFSAQNHLQFEKNVTNDDLDNVTTERDFCYGISDDSGKFKKMGPPSNLLRSDNLNVNDNKKISLQTSSSFSGTGSFVANKRALFEKVAQDEHRKFIMCEEQSKRIDNVPKKSRVNMEKFYGLQRIEEMAARASEGLYCTEYNSDSEGYESNGEGQSYRQPTSPTFSARRSPIHQNSVAMDKGNRNMSTNDERYDNSVFECHFLVNRDRQDFRCSNSNPDFGHHQSSAAALPKSVPAVSRLRSASSIEERLPAADDAFSLCYDDEEYNFEHQEEGLHKASSYSGDYSILGPGMDNTLTCELDTPDEENDDVFDELVYKVLQNAPS
ncbi:hypothetical protein FHG87_022217 [Trinorchestia longiramus]|nr:hypothetical protein FHG87_022217 [Trinorchestia longiramus]